MALAQSQQFIVRSPQTKPGFNGKKKLDKDKEMTSGHNKRQPSFKEKREFEILEKEIAELTKEKNVITLNLNNGETPFDELQRLASRIGEVTKKLDEKEFRWLELSELFV